MTKTKTFHKKRVPPEAVSFVFLDFFKIGLPPTTASSKFRLRGISHFFQIREAQVAFGKLMWWQIFFLNKDKFDQNSPCATGPLQENYHNAIGFFFRAFFLSQWPVTPKLVDYVTFLSPTLLRTVAENNTITFISTRWYIMFLLRENVTFSCLWLCFH